MRLSNKKHWDDIYNNTRVVDGSWIPIHYEFRAIAYVLEYVMQTYKPKSIMEIGAGDSVWLAYLAKKYNVETVIGIDYSTQGCNKLEARFQSAGVKGIVLCEDIFSLSSENIKVDFIFSLGFIEHFDDTKSVVSTLGNFLNNGGIIANTIPNFSKCSFHKLLVWAYQPDVLNMHNLLSLNDMVLAHDLDNYRHIKSDYLGIFSMGILAYGVKPRFRLIDGLCAKMGTILIKLTRKILRHFDSYGGNSVFAPYIYCITQKKA